MFRDMIKAKCDAWYNSDECTVKDLVSYISIRGAMRDAQVEAIKIYLFLKIGCDNRPLGELFSSGRFNTLDLDAELLSRSAYDYIKANPSAAAFYELCHLNASADKNIAKMLEVMKSTPEELDYDRIFRDVFQGVTYTDYVFSLPMGAGKTFLMAALIYLDLYFSMIEPDNPAFAENFIVMAPAGLKNSIIPSLRTIERFNPEWVIDEASAKALKLEMRFDVLDAETSKGDSNRVRNPNARKVAMYRQGGDMRAVTLVTNAEKVISDTRLEKGQMTLDGSEGSEMFQNELRAQIARIPRLTILVDEAHHTAKDTIQLRSVISGWAESGNVVSVIGFTGTPYLEKSLKIPIHEKLKLTCDEMSDVVFYYPLVNGINNFLKVPEIKQYENRENYLEIVDDGLRSFLDNNLDFRYPNGCVPKVAIYCNSTQELEETVYPRVCEIVSEYGLEPFKTVLRYHEDKAPYKLASDAKMNFATLDEPGSNIRVILLIQIGKEGWDCKSLASVILAKENTSTRISVLQMCCRCLRQVVKYNKEKAWIYLCKSNAEILESQLRDQQRITMKEFQEGKPKPPKTLRFYNRRDVIGLPDLTYYQFRMESVVVNEEEHDVERNLKAISLGIFRNERTYRVTDFDNRTRDVGVENNEHGDRDVDVANFNSWVGAISKGGYGFVTRRQLFEHEDSLRVIFDAMTIEVDGIRYFSSKFDRPAIEAEVRKSFYSKRSVDVRTRYEIDKAYLLCINDFKEYRDVPDPDRYVPTQYEVSMTYVSDGKGFEGREHMLRRYHYMPYHMDSTLETRILDVLHAMTLSQYPDLEVYYNGDRFMSDFHIMCYEHVGHSSYYRGRYTPDFIVLRREDESIAKAIIIETKGSLYAQDRTFNLKRRFIEEDFIPQNNARFGYDKFDYLYIQDDMSDNETIKLIRNEIESFFRRS